jgi:succinate dehydrogenase flavin-adding protein (antitoxin of CptAB toxin-antitoxin module)
MKEQESEQLTGLETEEWESDQLIQVLIQVLAEEMEDAQSDQLIQVLEEKDLELLVQELERLDERLE